MANHLNGSKTVLVVGVGHGPIDRRAYVVREGEDGVPRVVRDMAGQGEKQEKKDATVVRGRVADKDLPKMLGVYVDPALSLAPHRRMTVASTVKAYTAAAAAVAGVGAPCPAIGVRALYQANGRLLHGAEAWATAERGYRNTLLQGLRRACCRVLNIPERRAAAAFVLAELGIIPPDVLLFSAVLMQLAEVQVLPPSREMRRVFDVSRVVVQDAAESGAPVPPGTWAAQVEGVCGETGMQQLLEQPDQFITEHVHVPGPGNLQLVWPGRARMGEPVVQRAWVRAARRTVKAQVRAWGRARWERDRARCHSLQDYATLHPTPTFALYLRLYTAMPAAMRLVCLLRGGLYPLATVIRHHAVGDTRRVGAATAPSAACPLCRAPAETTAHLVTECPALATARGTLGQDMLQVTASDAAAAVFAEAQALGEGPTARVVWQLALGGAPRTAAGKRIPTPDLLAMYRVAGRALVRMTRARLRQFSWAALAPADVPFWERYSIYTAGGRGQQQTGSADGGGHAVVAAAGVGAGAGADGGGQAGAVAASGTRGTTRRTPSHLTPGQPWHNTTPSPAAAPAPASPQP
jgi:hypothetical protein